MDLISRKLIHRLQKEFVVGMVGFGAQPPNSPANS